jgi:hypothetical protein
MTLPQYPDGAAFESVGSVGGIKVHAIAGLGTTDIGNAKILLGRLSRTDLGKEIISRQANGTGLTPYILINSGATSTSGGLNFTFKGSTGTFIFIDTRVVIDALNTDLQAFDVTWQRILVHEFVHAAFPNLDGPGVIRRTNSVKSLWNGVYDREPACHDFGC